MNPGSPKPNYLKPRIQVVHKNSPNVACKKKIGIDQRTKHFRINHNT